MKRLFLHICFSLLVVLSFVNQVFSQRDSTDNNAGRFVNKLSIGGNIGLQFGTYTFVDISPLVGYNITEDITAGVGFTYIYFQDKREAYSTNIYGGRVFVRYLIFENIFAHAEYELLNMEDYYRGRINVASVFIGGGIKQQMGGNSFMTLMILYNINEPAYSPYQNPIIRAGFSFGL